MRYAGSATSLSLLFVAACSRSFNPCREGMVLSGRLCVYYDASATERDSEAVGIELGASNSPDNADTNFDARTENEATNPNALDAGNDASATHDLEPSMPDATASADATTDASLNAAPLDATTDASDDATQDADALISDADHPDADAGAEACEDKDLTSWRDFQITGRLVPAFAACFAADPRCAKGQCDLVGCLRAAAGMTGCGDCITEETSCTLGACLAECSASSGSDACRACSCREGCIGAGGCAMGAVDVCADCNERTCQQMSGLDPALIMVVIDPY